MKIQRTTLEYWALIAEITGAVAIVASVIYLGVQIRACMIHESAEEVFDQFGL